MTTVARHLLLARGGAARDTETATMRAIALQHTAVAAEALVPIIRGVEAGVNARRIMALRAERS